MGVFICVVLLMLFPVPHRKTHTFPAAVVVGRPRNGGNQTAMIALLFAPSEPRGLPRPLFGVAESELTVTFPPRGTTRTRGRAADDAFLEAAAASCTSATTPGVFEDEAGTSG